MVKVIDDKRRYKIRASQIVNVLIIYNKKPFTINTIVQIQNNNNNPSVCLKSFKIFALSIGEVFTTPSNTIHRFFMHKNG